MSAEQFDVVIIGGGNAGIGVTGPVRRAGLIAREKDMIKDIPDNLARAMARRGVEVIRGHGKFAGPDSVRIGDRMLHAGHIVIAAGSKPRPLPIPGAEHMVTSEHMLAESKRPKSIVFIGGGVISLEFGHVYARDGSTVTILEALPQLLPAMDSDAVARLQAESKRIGLQISTGVRIERIEAARERFRVIFTQDGAEKAVEADWVVNGAGRIADFESLGLSAGQVDHDNGPIGIDSHLRSTSNPRVYICGDVVPMSPQLSPIATYEGDLVGRNIVDGPKHSPDYASIATAVHTVPALAAVGLTEAAAKAKGAAADIHVNDMHDWFSARTYAETVAWIEDPRRSQ